MKKPLNGCKVLIETNDKAYIAIVEHEDSAYFDLRNVKIFEKQDYAPQMFLFKNEVKKLAILGKGGGGNRPI